MKYKPNEKTILIDASSILYKYALTDNKYELTTSDGTIVTCVYSFLSDMLDLSLLFNTNKIIVTFDAKTNLRKDLCPTYKSNRREVPEEIKERRRILHTQIPVLRDFLTASHIQWAYEEGYESDDLIASFIYNNPYTQFVTVSSDHDMYQTICDNNIIFNPNKKSIIDTSEFQKMFPNLPPKDYWRVLSIAGCTTDHVEGVRGIGEKTAYKYLIKSLRPESKAYNTIQSNKDTAYFTQKLVKLPFKNCPPQQISNERPDFKGFCEMCEKYEFTSFLKDMFNNWLLFFSMR